MIPEYAWTQNRYDKGNWIITEHVEQYGEVKEWDWGGIPYENRIEAVAAILKRYPDAKFNSWMDEWYIDARHRFTIWDMNTFAGPHGETWEEEA